MINLLPPDKKKDIRASYSNTLLLRYLILLVGALAFLLIALGVTYFSLSSAGAQADATRAENEQRATGYAETQAAATQLRSSLSSANSLFDDEIRYSLVLMRLSGLLPDGSAIDSFSIDSASFSQPISLNVQVRDQNAAKSLYENFEASPYVTDVSFNGVSTTTESRYRYSVDLSFTFTDEVKK